MTKCFKNSKIYIIFEYRISVTRKKIYNMKMTIETRSTANTGEETGAQDPARLEYEKRKAEIKEKREKIEAEIWQIEVKKKSKKGGPED